MWSCPVDKVWGTLRIKHAISDQWLTIASDKCGFQAAPRLCLDWSEISYLAHIIICMHNIGKCKFTTYFTSGFFPRQFCCRTCHRSCHKFPISSSRNYTPPRVVNSPTLLLIITVWQCDVKAAWGQTGYSHLPEKSHSSLPLVWCRCSGTVHHCQSPSLKWTTQGNTSRSIHLSHDWRRVCVPVWPVLNVSSGLTFR